MDNDDESMPKPPIRMKTHPFNSYVPRNECVAYVNCPTRKLFPSHAQIFNLIANCLDQSDIPLFLSLSNSIRTYSQSRNEFVVAFNEEGPLFIHPKIQNIFGKKKIGKTPALTIVHCLECLPTTKKQYRLFPCNIAELGKASDNAYLIIGELNKIRRHIEVKENNKNVAHGPFICYVLSYDNKLDGKLNKLDGKHTTETFTTVLYIPSTGQYFSQ